MRIGVAQERPTIPVQPNQRGLRATYRGGLGARAVRAFIAVSCALASAAVAGPSASQARLEYHRGSEAADCPDEETVRQAVRARLGFGPFQETAPLTVKVRLDREGDTLAARIELEDALGQRVGERVLTADRKDCRELAAALELAVSLAIDPQLLARAHPESQPKRVPLQPSQTPPTRPTTRASLHLGVGATGSWGLLPSPTLGVGAHGRFQWARFSLGIDLRLDPRDTLAARGGQVDSALLAGALSACLHEGRFGACAVSSGGALRVVGRGYDDPQQTTAPYAAVGGRAFVEAPFSSNVALRFQAELLVPLFRTVFLVSAAEVWRNPIVSGSLGLSVVVRFGDGIGDSPQE